VSIENLSAAKITDIDANAALYNGRMMHVIKYKQKRKLHFTQMILQRMHTVGGI